MTSRRYRRILTPPKSSFFVYGVRGVGKTTWARQTFPEAHNAQAEFFEQVFYWAPAQARQTEVDFLLRRHREYLAIEVKAQSRFSTPELAGLRAINDLPKLARRILVYLGPRQLRTEDGIDVWPFDRFSAALASRSLWP